MIKTISTDANRKGWEDISCDWCGSSESDILFSGPDRLERLSGTFKMVKCTHCGLIRQNPRLTWSLQKKYYTDDYTSYSTLIQKEKNALRRFDRRWSFWRRRTAIERFQKGGRLLDIGCGTGLFLEEAKRSNKWNVVGIEPNGRAADYAQQNLNVPILHGRFSEVSETLPPNSFDVIVLWNVLEHLEHPIKDLRIAHNLLKQNGWIVFSIPNMRSLDHKIFKEYWVGWDLPRHLWLFERDILLNILQGLGFYVVSERCISTGMPVQKINFEFWSQSWDEKYPQLKKYFIRISKSMITRAFFTIPLFVLDQLKFSPIITIIARKQTIS